jgi:hypothetical protein
MTKVKELRALSVTGTIRPTLFPNTINSERCDGKILAAFFERLRDIKKKYRFLQQGCGTAHTINSSVGTIWKAFRKQTLILCGLLIHLF